MDLMHACDNNDEYENLKTYIQPAEIVSSDQIENKIMALDYTGREVCDDVTNKYHRILIEKDKLLYTFEKQLMNIRVQTLNNCNEINLKLSELTDGINSIKVENQEKSGIIQLLREKLEFFNELDDKNFKDEANDSQNSDYELYEGKLLISEQINQLEESSIDVENYQLPHLINMLLRSILDKEEQLESNNKQCIQNMKEQNHQFLKEINDLIEWKKHLENENDKLFSEIEKYKHVQNILIDKDNELSNLKEDYSKIQLIYNEECKKNLQLNMLIEEYHHKLNEKELKCVDSNILIKTLESNLIQESKKLINVSSLYAKEKENFLMTEKHTQQMIEEFTKQIEEKNNIAISLKNDHSNLKYHTSLAEAEIVNLKQNIITLEYQLNLKNKTIQDLLKKYQNGHSTKLNDLLQTLSRFEQQMDIVLDDLFSCKKKLFNYENVLNSMQETVQHQLETKNNRTLINTKIEPTKFQELLKNATLEKDEILSEHQNEIESLKQKHNFEITLLNETEKSLKNEINDLNKCVQLKSEHLGMAEKIAKSQLQEATKVIYHLTEINTTQSYELNNLKNKITEKQNTLHSNTSNQISNRRGALQMKCLIDLLKKLSLENQMMKKMCHVQCEK